MNASSEGHKGWGGVPSAVLLYAKETRRGLIRGREPVFNYLVINEGAGGSAKTVVAGAGSADRGVPLKRRAELLSGVPAFDRLPDEALEELAALLTEERYPAGAAVVAEGDRGDRLYLISAGHAEVSAAGSNGHVPLATLGPGEMFGEIALLEPGGKRQATVTATTPLLALSLAAPAFEGVLDAYPEARRAFSEAAEEMLVAKFLKQATPFATLDAERLRRLASRLERLSVPAGDAVVRQGEVGEACYLLRERPGGSARATGRG